MNIPKIKLNKLFKEDDSRFTLACGLKFTLIFLVVMLFIYYVIWVILSINNVYFESYGFFTSEEFKEAFFDNALQIVYNRLPAIFSFMIFLFFAGVYVGKILLRPFEIIGKHCINLTEGKKDTYNPDIFSDYKLLTRFSEFFFRFVEERLREKELKPNTIPPNFTKIHGPQFEKVFFFHFLLFVGIVSIVSATFAIYMTTEIQTKVVNLSISSIQVNNSNVAYFLDNQREIFQSMIYVSVSMISICYILLSFHLYSKVSGAIFGFFATMRAFMKGNYKARVHLIGYAQIRPHGRALNKFLDYIERECASPKNKVES